MLIYNLHIKDKLEKLAIDCNVDNEITVQNEAAVASILTYYLFRLEKTYDNGKNLKRLCKKILFTSDFYIVPQRLTNNKQNSNIIYTNLLNCLNNDV